MSIFKVILEFNIRQLHLIRFYNLVCFDKYKYLWNNQYNQDAKCYTLRMSQNIKLNSQKYPSVFLYTNIIAH